MLIEEMRERLEELRPAYNEAVMLEAALQLHDRGHIDIEGGLMFPALKTEFSAADERALEGILA